MWKIYLKHVSNILVTHSSGNLVLKRFAGHSKWQNIRHIKELKDIQKSQMFTKLGKQMRIAVQEGGSIDPKSNLKLSHVIEQAKRYNMPAATIQSLLKSCQEDKTNSKSFIMDIKGPGSCFILLEVISSKPHVFKQNISTILKKFKSKHGDGNGQHIFEEKSIIIAECPISNATENELLEAATDHAIECGAEEVKILENNIVEFISGKTNLSQVVAGLEKLGYTISSATVEFIPRLLQNLSEEDLEVCSKLYEKFETLSEITRISDNIA